MPAPAVDFAFRLHTPFSAKARVAGSNPFSMKEKGGPDPAAAALILALASPFLLAAMGCKGTCSRFVIG